MTTLYLIALHVVALAVCVYYWRRAQALRHELRESVHAHQIERIRSAVLQVKLDRIATRAADAAPELIAEPVVGKEPAP